MSALFAYALQLLLLLQPMQFQLLLLLLFGVVVVLLLQLLWHSLYQKRLAIVLVRRA